MKTSLLLLIALILALSVFASAGTIVAPKKHSPGKTCKNYAWSAFKCKASKEICKAWKRHPRKCIGHEKIPICKKWKHRKGQCKKVKTFTKCKWEKKSKQVCKKVRVPYTKQFTKCSRTGKRHCKKFHHYKKCNKYKKTYKCVKYAKKIIKIRVCKKISKKHRKIVKKESKHKKHSKKHHRRHHKKHPKKRCFIKKIVKINKKKCLKRKCTGKKCCSWVTKRGKCKVWSKRKLVCKKYTKKLFKIVNKCKTVHYRKCHKFTFKKCVCRYKKNKCAIKIYKKGKCNKWKKGKKYCARKAKVCVKRCQFAKCGAKPKRD